MTETLELPGPLVGTDWLAERIDDPRLRLYDCSVLLLPDPPRPYRIESGRSEYEAGHLPGAAFLDLIEDLSDTSGGLPFMNPEPASLAAALGAAGLGDGDTAVLYASGLPWATRLWWMLREIGFDRAAVLDGGIGKWRAEDRAIETGERRYDAATLTPGTARGLFVGKETVLERLGQAGVAVVNALSPQMHCGEAPANYGRPGCIAGSSNVFFQDLLDAEAGGVFRDADALASSFRGAGVGDDDEVIMYCGGGISATVDAFALHLLGRDRVRVYDGSLTEWAKDPSLPMSLG